MAFSIGELVGTISLNDQFSGPVGDLQKKFGESFQAITGFAGIVTAAIAGTTAAVVALGQRGAEVGDVRDAFEQLTERAGESADAMIGELRTATLGTISDFDLMKMSTAALGAGMVRSKEDMATLAAGAKMLADRTGGDTADAFERLTSSMEKGKASGLKSLGLFVDMKAATEDYAKSIGKSEGDLTQQERALAVNRATLSALKDQLERAGPASADFGDQVARAKVAVQNFTDNLAVAVAQNPVVAAGLDAVSQAFQSAFGGNQTDLIQTLMGYVADFAIGLTYVAQAGATGATVFVTAWYAVKTVVLGVITAVSGVTTAIATLVDAAVDIAAKVPGASSVLGDLAGVTEEFRNKTEAATLSLASETAEAARGVMGNSALHATLDTLGGSIMNVRDRMEEARAKMGETTEKAAEMPPVIDDITGSNQALTQSFWEQMEAAAETYNQMFELLEEANAKHLELSQAIQLANSTGLEQKLFQIEFERQAELAALQEKFGAYSEVYEALVALTNEKYTLMGQAARGYHADIVVQAGMAGFRTREELEQTAANARDTYERMLDSGKYTYSELQKAHQKAKEAEDKVNQTSAMSAIQGFNMIADAAKNLLRAAFGNNKASAIAISLIDTAQAVVKALASAPPPLNYALAAAVGAAGLLQTNKIRSQDAGFAFGTEGTRFEDFGRGSVRALHGREAVVTPRQATSVAEMVEDVLKQQDSRLVSKMDQLMDQMDDRDRQLPILLRDAALKMV